MIALILVLRCLDLDHVGQAISLIRLVDCLGDSNADEGRKRSHDGEYDEQFDEGETGEYVMAESRGTAHASGVSTTRFRVESIISYQGRKLSALAKNLYRSAVNQIRITDTLRNSPDHLST